MANQKPSDRFLTGFLGDIVERLAEPVEVGFVAEAVPGELGQVPEVVAGFGLPIAGIPVQRAVEELPHPSITTEQPGLQVLALGGEGAREEFEDIRGAAEARRAFGLLARVTTEVAVAEAGIRLIPRFFSLRKVTQPITGEVQPATIVDDAFRGPKIDLPEDLALELRQMGPQGERLLLQTQREAEALAPRDIRQIPSQEGVGSIEELARAGAREPRVFEIPEEATRRAGLAADLEAQAARETSAVAKQELLDRAAALRRGLPEGEAPGIPPPGPPEAPPGGPAGPSGPDFGAEGFTTEIISPEAFRKVTSAANEVGTRAGIPRSPGERVSDYLIRIMENDEIPDALVDQVFRAHGVEYTDVLGAMTGMTRTKAGQTLNLLSRFQERMLRRRISKEVDPENFRKLRGFVKQPSTKVDMQTFRQRSVSLFRRLIITQPATAMRNMTVGFGRVGDDTLVTGFEVALERMFSKPNLPRTHPADTFGTAFQVFTGKGKKITGEVLEFFPKLEQELFLRYASDIARRTGKVDFSKLNTADRIFTRIEDGAEVLNALNRWQDWWFRRAVFSSKFLSRLEKRGMTLEQFLARSRQAEQTALRAGPKGGADFTAEIASQMDDFVHADDLQFAISEALDFTFGGSPQHVLTKAYVNFANRAVDWFPLLAAAQEFTFPRFLANASKFIFERSPFAIFRFANPAQRARIAAGDMREVAKIAAGMTEAGFAWMAVQGLIPGIKPGPRWYLWEVGGKTLDIRNFFPLSAYAFTADTIKRLQEGRLGNLDLNDVKRGILGLRGGLQTEVIEPVRQLWKWMVGTGDPEKAMRRIKELAGGFAGGFVPGTVQGITDVLSQFTETQQISRDTSEEPFLGQFKRKLPGGAGLPPRFVPTRPEPATRPSPGLRQLTGFTEAPAPNLFETELGRLGFRFQEVLPRSGDPVIDQAMSKHMGQLTEQMGINPYLASGAYDTLSDPMKAVQLERFVSMLRAQATERMQIEAATNPDLLRRILKQKERRRSRRERQFLESVGVQPAFKIFEE